MAVAPPLPMVQTAPQVETISCAVEEIQDLRIPTRDAWLALLEHSPNAKVVHHPDYTAAVAADNGFTGLVVTCSRDENLLAMLILIPKRCRFGRQVLPGARSAIPGLRLAGSAILGSEEPAVVEALVEELARELQRRRVRVLEFEELPEASVLWTAMQKLRPQGFRFAPANGFDLHHRIKLPASAAEFWKTFNSKHRLRMRKEREKLGQYELKRYSQPGEVDDWLAAAHEISRKTWQSAQLGLRIQNTETDRRFLQFLAALGAWRSYILFREGQPAAFALSFQWKEVYYYDEIGFDRSLVKLFPGKVMLQEILTDVMTTSPARLFDFGLGDAEYKRFFSNEHGRSAKLWMFPPGLSSRWQTASMNARRTLGRMARDLVAHMPWYERLRSKLRNAATKSTTCLPGAALVWLYQVPLEAAAIY